jgi:hypothetical protein
MICTLSILAISGHVFENKSTPAYAERKIEKKKLPKKLPYFAP